MAIAAEGEGFLGRARIFRYGHSYEPIDNNHAHTPHASRCPGRQGGRWQSRSVLVACVLVCAAVAALGLASTKGPRLPSGPTRSASFATFEETARRPEGQERRYHQHQMSLLEIPRGPSLQVRVANHYQRDPNATTDLYLYPWEHIAEPHRNTTLELTQVPDGVQDGAYVM